MEASLPDSSMFNWWHSRRLQYLLLISLIYIGVLFLLRIIFLAGFSDLDADLTDPDIRRALSVGFRFDIRLAILLTLPLAILAWLPRLNLVNSALMRKVAIAFNLVVMACLLVFYMVDFGYYLYLGVRINSTALRFLHDFGISMEMAWQSYPVVWLVSVCIALLAVYYLVLRKMDDLFLKRKKVFGKVNIAMGVICCLLLTMAGIHGRIMDINLYNPVPLRWNDAYFSENTEYSALGLNPVLFFYDTFMQKDTSYDLQAVAATYPAVAAYLEAEVSDDYSLDRLIKKQPHAMTYDTPPNVIFIMLESLGASRLGIYGNPVQPSPSPNLDELSRSGWLFRNFYVPVSGTAKTVWASLTGIPDVSSDSTATRNPLITNQRVILNHFSDHEKYYFIGGAAGWANMSAFIRQSIPDIRLYEEGSWLAPVVDVWGISDLDLFKEVNTILADRSSAKPFFAFIQTAGNHRPFTVPENNDDFIIREDLPADELAEAGFRNNAQFNAVRLLDYNVGRFMEMAEDGGYLNNTIFVFFGDHNNRVTETPFMAPHFDALDLDGLHVPHIIFAPAWLEPKIIDDAVSLLDVMPTVAGWLGIEYLNSSMGRDININAPELDRSVYVQTADRRFPVIGMVNKNKMLRMSRDGSNARLHDISGNNPRIDVASQYPDQFDRMRQLAMGIYENSHWQFYANRKTHGAGNN